MTYETFIMKFKMFNKEDANKANANQDFLLSGETYHIYVHDKGWLLGVAYNFSDEWEFSCATINEGIKLALGYNVVAVGEMVQRPTNIVEYDHSLFKEKTSEELLDEQIAKCKELDMKED